MFLANRLQQYQLILRSIQLLKIVKLTSPPTRYLSYQNYQEVRCQRSGGRAAVLTSLVVLYVINQNSKFKLLDIFSARGLLVMSLQALIRLVIYEENMNSLTLKNKQRRFLFWVSTDCYLLLLEYQ